MDAGLDLSLGEIVAATGGTVVSRLSTRFRGVTIDGRATTAGDLYFAVQGERFDGHDFCAQAVAAGATGLVVARANPKPLPGEATIVEVDETRLAIAQVAQAVRRRSRARVVGVTGSAGKTTTKELVRAALAGVAGADAVLATEGSLNNETGVPQTLCKLRPQHEYAVVEMGMRGLGQIEYLTRFTEPDVGVVVNAGVAHVGVVGSVEAIAAGKSEIWGGLRPGGVAVYPHGDERLRAHAIARVPVERHVTFGEEPEATVRWRDVTPRGARGADLWFDVAPGGGERLQLHCRLPLVGRHNAGNAACALGVALALGVDLEAAVRGLEQARPARQRSEILEVGGRFLLNDCYNANPASMRAAIETLAELAGKARTVAVLGDMLELGDAEEDEHAQIGFLLRTCGVQRVVAIGERARHYARGASQAGVKHIVETDDAVLAARVVASWTDPGDWVLVKASRGMRLERVIDALKEIVS